MRKPGYFASEADIIEELRDATGTGRARNPICILVEAADDIVYLAADVEDAVKKGVLPWSQVQEQLTAQNMTSVKDALHVQDQILKAGRSSVPGDLDDDIWASAFRTAAISVMVRHAFRVFQARYDQIMNGTYSGSLLEESDAADLAGCLRSIGIDHVYPTPSTLRLELMGRHVIGNLMDVFWEGAKVVPKTGEPRRSTFAGKAAALISRNYRRVFQHSLNEGRLPEKYCRIQLVTDYICGMTDSFAKNLHAELFNG